MSASTKTPRFKHFFRLLQGQRGLTYAQKLRSGANVLHAYTFLPDTPPGIAK